MHNRRTRPTLRVLREDLAGSGELTHVRRALGEGRFDDLGPLSELPHPLVLKAAADIGMDPEGDSPEGFVQVSTSYPLYEIKTGQWRGGVWRDGDTGVNWLVVAGLAKGGHRDHEDFYQRVERAQGVHGACQSWLPTAADEWLLTREALSSARLQWLIDIQRSCLEALEVALGSGRASFVVDLPLIGKVLHMSPSQRRLAEVLVEFSTVRGEGADSDDVRVVFDVVKSRQGSNLAWEMLTRVLISLLPPEQGWDADHVAYWTIAEPGSWTERVEQLRFKVGQGVLEESVPGMTSHRAHRVELAGKTVHGSATRALCGVHFVPRQDHEALPPCSACEAELVLLPPAPRSGSGR